MTVSELTTDLGLRQSNASAAVKALADRGLVRRQSSPSDRRLALLHPTEAALKNKDLIEEFILVAHEMYYEKTDKEIHIYNHL